MQVDSWNQGVMELDEGFPLVCHFHETCLQKLMLFYILMKKIPFKCGVFGNVIVQYKFTVTNSFKQDRLFPALF